EGVEIRPHVDAIDVAEAARWVAAASDPAELVAYLDDSTAMRHLARRDEASWRRVLALARAFDPDPWRNDLRALIGRTDAEAIASPRRLADDPAALDAQPAASLVLLAKRIKANAGDFARAERVLARAAPRHSDDFWARYEFQGSAAWDSVSTAQT